MRLAIVGIVPCQPRPIPTGLFPSSLLKWQGIDPATSPLLKRVAAAPSFESVIADRIVNYGADIPDPGSQYQLNKDSPDMFAGIPRRVVKYIVTTAKTEADVARLVKDYKDSLEQ